MAQSMIANRGNGMSVKPLQHILCELERRHRRRLDEIESSGIY